MSNRNNQLRSNDYLALLPSEWVIFGETFPERLAGEEVGGGVPWEKVPGFLEASR